MTANWLCGMNANTRTLPRLVWWHHIRAGINGDGLLSTKICGLSSRGSSCEGTSCAASQPLSGTSSSCLHKTTRTRAEQAAAQPLCQTGLVRTVGCHQPLMLCPAHVERCGQPERRRRRGGREGYRLRAAGVGSASTWPADPLPSGCSPAAQRVGLSRRQDERAGVRRTPRIQRYESVQQQQPRFEASESDAKEAAVLVLQPMKMHFRVTSE